MDQLVEYIFSPSPDSVLLQNAQNELRGLQRGPNGWHDAQQLLASGNPNVQFIAAQTFHVQLNQPEFLPERNKIKQDLLDAVESSVQRGLQPFVVRKLLSAIAKLFLAHDDWPDAPLAVVQRLAPSPVAEQTCFEFMNFLVEDSELPAQQLRARLVPSVADLVKQLVSHTGLTNVHAVKCIEVWGGAFFDVFSELLPPIIGTMQQLFAHQEKPSETDALIACVSTLFSNHWRVWKPSCIHQLDAALVDMAERLLAQIAANTDDVDEELLVTFTRLVIEVCEQDFGAHNDLHGFLAAVASSPTPVVEDPLASEVLEFWNQYTEEIISNGMTSTENAKVIVSVIQGYWPRIKLYHNLAASEWDEMASFRKDFTDFLELAYPLLGLELFEYLANVVLSSISSTGDWYAIESALYCLNGLADIIGSDYEGNTPEFASVQRIFQSPLWEELPNCDNLRVKQTAVNTIGCFVDFFMSPQGQPYLAVTLNYLFSSLYTPFLQSTASRSIQKLCDICRSRLTNEIPAFLAVYKQTRPQLQSVPHIRTVGAVACVIQAVTDDNTKIQYVADLFNLVVNMPVPDAADMPLEQFEQMRLKCIATLGKRLSAPESENGASVEPSLADAHLQVSLRPQLQEIITLAALSLNLGITEALCEIIKVCLYDEVYSLDEKFIVWFVVTKASAGVSELVFPIMDLAKNFVSTRLANIKRGVQPQLSIEAMQQLLDLAVLCGTEAMSYTIDMLTQLVLTLGLSGWSHQHQQPQPHFILKALDIPIKGIGSTDRFVLRSAVAFWKEYLATFPLSEEVGALLITILLIQVSGNASRSEIPPVADVFKALMLKQPIVGTHLLKQYAIDNPVGRSLPKQDEKSRKAFVSQLVLVKGGRKTTEIVQQFWLKCRGIPASYDPKT